MEENNSSEIYLTVEERLGIMKDSLRKVIEIVTDEKTDEIKKAMLVDRTLEEFFLHIEAAGPDLALNIRQKTVLGTIQRREGFSPEAIAHRCAQLLGTLNYEDRFAKPYNNQSLVIKVLFLKEAKTILEKLVNGQGTMNELYALEELISGFLCLEDGQCDDEVQKVCFGIEESIRDAFHPGGRINFLRLKIQQGVVMAIRTKLQTALS